MNLLIKYKNYYENLIKEYTENNINGCNDNKIEFYKKQLEITIEKIKELKE